VLGFTPTLGQSRVATSMVFPTLGSHCNHMANLKLVPHDIVKRKIKIVDWFILGF
jgi:hypothetical protein